MRAMIGNEVGEFIMNLAEKIAGAKIFSEDARIYADLGISGNDAIDLYNKIEDHFKVNTRPVTEDRAYVSPRLFRKGHWRAVPRDPTLRELRCFVERELS